MINILLPMGGKSIFFDAAEFYYPKPLLDVADQMMIERVVRSLDTLTLDKKFLFVINHADAVNFHLDKILKLIAKGRCEVIEQKGDTMGALCSCLLMIEHIDNDLPLIIANSDQILDVDYDKVIAHFRNFKADAGAITFPSFHPRWSYVFLDENGLVVETAEKKPISEHAVAGFYYYSSGRLFVEAAKSVIEKNDMIQDRFFISSSFNELILRGCRLTSYPIAADQYHSFFSPERIARFSDQHLKD